MRPSCVRICGFCLRIRMKRSPHNYEITAIEAYMDLFHITGVPRYLLVGYWSGRAQACTRTRTRMHHQCAQYHWLRMPVCMFEVAQVCECVFAVRF